MYQTKDEKLFNNQSPSAAASFNSNTPAAYSGASSKPLVEWSTDPCDCLWFDPITCLCTCLCPCYTFGKIAEIVDRGSTSCCYSGTLYCCVIGCGWLCSCRYRSKIREQYNLKGSFCTDCMIHFCCESCALCQEYRELQNRGFNVGIGWHGSVEQRMAQEIAMSTTAPPVESGMNR